MRKLRHSTMTDPKSIHVCPICLDVMRNSVMLNNNRDSAEPCGHLFCYECIATSLKYDRRCPTCRTPTLFGEIVPDMRSRREIACLETTCKYSKHGCTWKGVYGLHHAILKEHEQGCTFRGKPCEDCKEIVAHEAISVHARNCMEKMVKCDQLNCGVEVKRRDLTHHQSNQCNFQRLKCPFASSPECKTVEFRHQMAAHMAACWESHVKEMNRRQSEMQAALQKVVNHQAGLELAFAMLCPWRGVPPL